MPFDNDCEETAADSLRLCAGLFSSLSPEISEMTFKDYALRDYDETSGILESDWYNAQVELLRLSSETWGNGLIQIEEREIFR